MITVYTTNQCAYCEMVKRYLNIKKVPYNVVSLDESDSKVRDEVTSRSGAMTVPVTVKGDWEAFVVGWKPGELFELIKE